jgi:hypothetical protein
METRRIRRLERGRWRRTVAIAAALGAIGVALGLALPQNTTASAVILVVAVGTLAAIALRAHSIRPSVGASDGSFWSSLVVTSRTPSGVCIAEDDDEAQAWWATPLELHTDAVSLIAGPSQPELTEASLDDVEPAPATLEGSTLSMGSS